MNPIRRVISSAIGWLYEADRKALAKAGGPGYASGGGYGAPSYTDAFGQRRAPLPWQLVNNFKGMCHACATINADAAAKQSLHLYVATGHGQSKPKCITRNPKRDVKIRRRRKYVETHAAYGGYLKSAEAMDEVAEHPLLEAVVEPNKDFDLQGWITYQSFCCDMFGAAYSWPDMTRGMLGKKMIWPLYGHAVYPIYRSASMSPDFFQYYQNQYTHDQVIRVRRISLRDPYGWGYGPAQAAFEYVAREDEDVSTSRAAMGQSIRTAMFISNQNSDQPIGDPEGKRLENKLNRMNAGNVGFATYIPAALKLDSWNPDFSSIFDRQLSTASLKMIAREFGTPWPLLDTDDVNLANAQAAHRQHSELSIEPNCVRMANGLTTWTRTAMKDRTTPGGRPLGWDRLFWAFDNPVSEDKLETAKIFKMRIDDYSITVNEVRAAYGDDPVDWGDEPWIKGILKQPSQMAEDREQAAKLAAAGIVPGKPGKPALGKEEPVDDDDGERDQAALEASESGKGKMALPFGQDPTPTERPPDQDAIDAAAVALVLDVAGRCGLARGLAEDRLTGAQRRRLLHAIADTVAADMKHAAQLMVDEIAPAKAVGLTMTVGGIDVDGKSFGSAVGRFFKGMKKAVRTLALAAALVFAGPTVGGMPADIKEAVAVQTVNQEKYLTNFEQQVRWGEQPVDATVPARAALYGQAGWSIGLQVVAATAKSRGMVQERNVLGENEHHCRECPALTELGWVPLGSLPPIGDRECRVFDRCRLEYMDAKGQIYDVPPAV